MYNKLQMTLAPATETGTETTGSEASVTGTTETEVKVEAKTEQQKADTLFTKIGETGGDTGDDKETETLKETSEEKTEDGGKKEEVSEGEKKSDDSGDVAPLTMDSFELPEGFEVDEKLSGKFLELVNDTDMSAVEKGQALINLQTETIKMAADKLSQAYIDTQTEWREAVDNDPDVGGSKLDDHVANAAKVLDTYGDKEFRQILDSTGAGNHISTFRFFVAISKVLNEGGPVHGQPEASAPASQADVLYPKQAKTGT